MIEFNLLLRLLFTHLVMDFVLQSSKMVVGKTSGLPKDRAKANLIHSALHAAAAYLVVADWTNWWIPLVIFVSHFAIDYWYKKDKKGVATFLTDQALHIAVLVALWLFDVNQLEALKSFLSAKMEDNRLWLVMIAYILVLSPTSLLIKGFIRKWYDEVSDKKGAAISLEERGLNEAGHWIGYIERVLILTFILINSLPGIGFLLAAKSIFRYGNLKENKDIRMTEYVLIGTLSSFAVAIFVGVILIGI